MNIINGGAHADNALDFQEFMIVPLGLPTFREALRAGAEVFHTLKKLLQRTQGLDRGRRRGRLRARSAGAEAACEVVVEAIEKAGYKPGKDVALALDVASSELCDKASRPTCSRRRRRSFDHAGLIDLYRTLWRSSRRVHRRRHGRKRLGRLDDADRGARRAGPAGRRRSVRDQPGTHQGRHRRGSANSVLVKVNQIGTLTETLESVEMAHRVGWTTIISHRSGETEDTFIADLAVAMRSGQIKTGSLARSERVAKYNRLLKIEHELGPTAIYPAPPRFGSSGYLISACRARCGR